MKLFGKSSKPKMPELSRDELRHLPRTVDPNEYAPFLVEYKKTMGIIEQGNDIEKLVLRGVEERAKSMLESLRYKDQEGGRRAKIEASGRILCGNCKHSIGDHV